MKLGWDFFFQAVLLVVCVVIPIQISFYDDDEFITTSSLIMYIIILFCYWTDIVIRLRTSKITANFHEITEPRLIAKKYLRTFRFLAHFVSSIPLLALGYIDEGLPHRLLIINLLVRLLDLRLIKMETILPLSMKRVWRLMITIAQFTILVK